MQQSEAAVEQKSRCYFLERFLLNQLCFSSSLNVSQALSAGAAGPHGRHWAFSSPGAVLISCYSYLFNWSPICLYFKQWLLVGSALN